MANLYAQPAQANIQPMDFSVYMAAQKAGHEAMQGKLALEARMLESDAQKAQLGTQAVMGVTSALDKIKAYGDTDEKQLGEIRAGYNERLQGLVKQGIEGGGLHTISNALRLESAKLNTEITRGELGNVQQRYDISQQNLGTISDLYTKGDMTNYDRHFYSDNLLMTPKKSNDILGDTTDFATANSLKNTSLRVLQDEYLQLAQTMHPEDYAKMVKYDKETGANSLANMENSIRIAAAIQHADGSGGGGPSSTYLGSMQNGGTQIPGTITATGSGDTAKRYWINYFGTSDKQLNDMTNNLTMPDSVFRTGDSDAQYGNFDAADEKLKNVSFTHTGINKKTSDAITPMVWSELNNLGIKSFDQDNTIDSGELIADLRDEDKYEKGSFRIVGTYGGENPYYPNGYAATAYNLDTKQNENFIVANPNASRYDRMLFETSQALFNKNARAAGQSFNFDITVSDAEVARFDQEPSDMSGGIALTIAGKDGVNRSKYKLTTKAMMIDIGGGQGEWQIIADIINTETGERVDISGTKGYSTLRETIDFLRTTYDDSFYPQY